MDKYDWIWHMTDGKNRWTSCIFVPIDGVFVCREPENESFMEIDKFFWFSSCNGVMAPCTRLHNRNDTWAVEEKATTYHITNKNKSCFNSITKDSYYYVNFKHPKNFIVLLKDDVIVGFISDKKKIMEFLL